MSKLGGAAQEADESQLWLELLREECGVPPSVTQPLEAESAELIAIFTTMSQRTEEKLKAKSKKLKAENQKLKAKN